MTSRRGGTILVILGLLLAAWAWFGIWPLAAPVYGSAADYNGLHGLSFALALAGSVTAIMGAFLVFAGRGGSESWDGPRDPRT
jgi:hypothetical protein